MSASEGPTSGLDESGPEVSGSAQAELAGAPARIAERVGALDSVGDLPLADHVAVYHRLHTELQAALAEIDGP